MTVVAGVLTALTPTLPNIVIAVCTGVFTIVAGFGGIRMTQRYGEKQRERERTAAANAKVEAVVQELIEAVSELRIDLSVHQPAYNGWRPRLMLLGDRRSNRSWPTGSSRRPCWAPVRSGLRARVRVVRRRG
ncbi:hypothetical protein ACTOB_003781 [Actinoplanes oblitus]|uniref:Uncharacterized protein n=1 Tax=Actinoplanes oblitus TaxID=3040509 RepID=A0ABY8WSL9_9ACTN|nr:hypothetical protein [Actinoplanes oblitus]WIN00099.1 hypothetical protein ACTOB_003781 [Actinoplanes oblitus]